jgi:lipopolysaccharide transport system ATP-binding protein
MTDNWTIRAEGLSKKFGLSLKQVMRYGLRDSLRRLVGLGDHTETLRSGEFWALRDVTFELNKGESLGIMGINGSGKTTLLRILHGIYGPDAGQVAMKGRVGALIAAGAGFAPMLTGRENVHINGALLGMTPNDISERLDDIIAFSELGEFIDMPVKHYSSGMYVRLGFAIAAMSEPEILLIDEVLAVGDMNFQKKCYDYLLRLKRQGTTIVLVSHSIGAIWAVCDKGIFLHEGELKVAGVTEDIVRAYDEQNARTALQPQLRYSRGRENAGQDDENGDGDTMANEYGHQKGGTGDAVISSLRVFGDDNQTPKTEFEFGESLNFELDVTVFHGIEMPLFRLAVDAVHYKFIATLDSYEQNMKVDFLEPGRYTVRVNVPVQNFRPGAYTVNLAICRRHMGVHVFYWFNALGFLIRHPSDRFLYSDSNAILHLDGDFHLESMEA